MRPENLKTKIFLDGGDPEETKEALDLLGFLDGQTTNPTLISKNPEVVTRLERGEYFSEEEVLEIYQSIVKEISQFIPNGSISIEVNANGGSSAQEMLSQARKMFSWIPNAHIKFPTIPEGLRAAEKAVTEGIRVNMTLCFTQEQAAAVHSATNGSVKGSVFVSPFVGRLDDLGYDGMGLIENIAKMYGKEGTHVELLVASVRTLDHLLKSFQLEADIVTVPLKVLKLWADQGMRVPAEDYQYDSSRFRPIPYKELDMKRPWEEIRFEHPLIGKGLEAFSKDWIKLTGN